MVVNDLIVLVDDAPTPPGYTKINKDLNEGAGGRYLYFAYRYGDQDPITAPIEAVYGDDPNIGCGSDFMKVPDLEGDPVDLNMGAGGKYIYICIRKGEGAPISGLDVVSGDSPDVQPDPPWLRVDVDLNLSVGGKYIFLCYRID